MKGKHNILKNYCTYRINEFCHHHLNYKKYKDKVCCECLQKYCPFWKQLKILDNLKAIND